MGLFEMEEMLRNMWKDFVVGRDQGGVCNHGTVVCSWK